MAMRDILPTVYSLCVIHAARNAKIHNSNIRSLCVQWAKCGNEEDSALKIEQLNEAKISATQLNYMLEHNHQVTYLGLNNHQGLRTNFEVVSNMLRNAAKILTIIEIVGNK